MSMRQARPLRFAGLDRVNRLVRWAERRPSGYLVVSALTPGGGESNLERWDLPLSGSLERSVGRRLSASTREGVAQRFRVRLYAPGGRPLRSACCRLVEPKRSRSAKAAPSQRGASDTLRAELRAERQRLGDLEVEVSALKQQRSSLEAELRTSRAQAQELWTELNASRAQVTQLEEEKDALEEQLAEISEHWDEWRGAIYLRARLILAEHGIDPDELEVEVDE